MGSEKDIFFDLELNPDDNTNQTFIALVKPEVVKACLYSLFQTRSALQSSLVSDLEFLSRRSTTSTNMTIAPTSSMTSSTSSNKTC
jgi:hypothetical protein